MEYHGVERIINVLPSDTLNQLSVEYPLYHPCSDIAMGMSFVSQGGAHVLIIIKRTQLLDAG